MLFKADQRLRSILAIFTCFSLLIAILGLFGLASFQSFEKAREVSIRKVLGATETQLMGLMTWKFAKLIILGNVIAIPIGYLALKEWLDSFAYRIDMPFYVFVAALAISLLVTYFTIFYHVSKTAKRNPVEVLAQYGN